MSHELDTYFSAPNELSMDTLSGSPGELVTRLAARVEQGHRSLLPARLGPVTRWYGIAPDSREERLLREELKSWLGPPITDTIVTLTTPRDDMDRRAQAAFNGRHLLSADVNDSWQQSARENVTTLLDVWSLAPERSTDVPRPVGRVLRQFYEALLGGSRHDAEAALSELRTRSLVNATNLRFLRVEMLSNLGLPQELRDDPQLQGLTLLARPPAVTERLADAAAVLVIQPARDAGQPMEVIGRALEAAWPGLVTELHEVSNVATARCLALAEITLPNPRGALLAQVATRYPDDPVLSEASVRWGSPMEPSGPASASELYHLGDYARALAAAEQQGSSRATVGIALAAAVNMVNGQAAARALALFASLAASDQQVLARNAVESVFLDRLQALTSDARTPSGWLDWLRGEWTDRPDLLADWAHAWASDSQPEVISGDLALELLAALNDGRRGRVRNGLPVFVNAVVGSQLHANAIPLAVTLLDILLSSEPGRIERQASLALLDEILTVGCSVQEYQELLRAIDVQMSLIGPRDASWLIQVLDLLLVHGSPATGQRDATLASGRATALAWRDRLDPLDQELLSRLFPGEGFEMSPTPGEPVAGEWRPRTVGIYSLLESATRQATDWINGRWPGVVVRTSSEHVNSDALTALARGVDVLLVQTSHAKHAATQGLEAALPDRSRLVLVNGRGATSLLRALAEWIAASRP